MIYGLWEHSALNNESKYMFAAVETRADKNCYVIQSYMIWNSLDKCYNAYEEAYGIPVSLNTLTLCYEMSPRVYTFISARVGAGGYYRLSDLEKLIKELEEKLKEEGIV